MFPSASGPLVYFSWVGYVPTQWKVLQKFLLTYSSHSSYTLSFFHGLLDYIKITLFHWGHLWLLTFSLVPNLSSQRKGVQTQNLNLQGVLRPETSTALLSKWSCNPSPFSRGDTGLAMVVAYCQIPALVSRSASAPWPQKNSWVET